MADLEVRTEKRVLGWALARSLAGPAHPGLWVSLEDD